MLKEKLKMMNGVLENGNYQLGQFQFVDLKQNPVPYIAVMCFGAWLLIFCERSRIE